jgi:magnesium transporter
MAKKEQQICEDVAWIDVSEPTVVEMEELSIKYGLNNHIVRDCMQPEHLPKYEFIDDVHFLILRFYSHNPDKRLATIQDLSDKIAIFYTDQFILTIHKSAAPFLDVVRRKYVGSGRCSNTTSVLSRIVWQALETYDDPVNSLSEQVDFYENQVMLKNTGNEQVEALYIIKREASVVHKILMLMQEPINHIFPKPGHEADLQDIRDQHLKMQTFYNQVLEDVNNLLNLSLSFAAQKTNDVVKVLTIFSVFFMPLTFIVGIYGMNFDFMPELRQRWGYPIVMLLMVLITFFIYSWFKRKKWL